MSEKRAERKVKKLKRKIDELMLLGGITSEEAEKMRSQTISTVSGDAPTTEIQASSSRASIALSKKIASVKLEKQGGPKLMLRLNGERLSNYDIASLAHYTTIGTVARKPRWMVFKPQATCLQTLVIRVNCPDDFIENFGTMAFIDEFFEKQWLKTSEEVSNREDFWKWMTRVPVPLQEQIFEKVIKDEKEMKKTGVSNLKSNMLMTAENMFDNGVPFPQDDAILATKKKYSPVTENSPLFAIDCEMCITSAGSELTRISLVNEQGDILLDTLVKPTNTITDYVTKFSGITKEMLEDVKVTLEDVQKAISVILPPDGIIVGHSLEFDLRALKMSHPHCIDIALLFNYSGSLRAKNSLRNLVYMHLGESIQSGFGHCSVEDAVATMKLAKVKLDKGLVYGNVRYGWDYASFKKTQNRRNDDEEEEEEAKEPTTKKEKTENPKVDPIFTNCTECGEEVKIDCMVINCECRKNTKRICVRCRANGTVVEGTVDWKTAVTEDTLTKFRTFDHYLRDKKKTVLHAHYEVPELKIEKTRITKLLKPAEFKDTEDFVDEVASEILAHQLTMTELDYSTHVNPKLEEGQVDDDVDLRKVIDENVEKLIRSASKYALIMLVLASPKSNILYVRVKP